MAQCDSLLCGRFSNGSRFRNPFGDNHLHVHLDGRATDLRYWRNDQRFLDHGYRKIHIWVSFCGIFSSKFKIIVFSIGAESLAVAQNSYAVLYFKGKELNMVFGLQLSFARVGSTVNFIVMEPIYKYVSHYYKGHQAIGVVLLIAFSTCIISMASALILGKFLF